MCVRQRVMLQRLSAEDPVQQLGELTKTFLLLVRCVAERHILVVRNVQTYFEWHLDGVNSSENLDSFSGQACTVSCTCGRRNCFLNEDIFAQIISFSTYEPLTADELLQSMRASPQCESGSLAVWEVVRAPKRFHALFSASWRRYIYIFPTKPGTSICILHARDSTYCNRVEQQMTTVALCFLSLMCC